MLCVLIRIVSFRLIEAILMSTPNIQLLWRKYRYLLPDLAPWLTLSGSNYPCLEQLSMVPKMFQPLKFDCSSLKSMAFPKHLIYLYMYRKHRDKSIPLRIKHFSAITYFSRTLWDKSRYTGTYWDKNFRTIIGTAKDTNNMKSCIIWIR